MHLKKALAAVLVMLLYYFRGDSVGGRRDATKRVPQTRSGEDCLSDWRPDIPYGVRDAARRGTGQDPRSVSSEKITASQAERLAGKEEEKRQRRIKKLEGEIEQLEAKIDELKEELCKPEYASMYSKLSEIQEQIDAAEAQLLETMEEWEKENNNAG